MQGWYHMPPTSYFFAASAAFAPFNLLLFHWILKQVRMYSPSLIGLTRCSEKSYSTQFSDNTEENNVGFLVSKGANEMKFSWVTCSSIERINPQADAIVVILQDQKGKAGWRRGVEQSGQQKEGGSVGHFCRQFKQICKQEGGWTSRQPPYCNGKR